MEKKVYHRAAGIVLLSVLLCLVSGQRSFSLQVGEPFPEFTMASTLAPDELAYLKAPAGRELSLKDIGHKIILIEFLNVYCHTCRGQVPIFNDLYAAIKKDPVLSKSVCMLGIAVGNSLEEVNEFKKTFGAVYPILPDPQKAVFNMTGNIRGTPQSYILSGDRERFIIYYHAGAVATPEPYLRELQSALRGEITGTAVGNKIPDYSFIFRGKTYSQKDFAGKKALIYFPAKKSYDLASDARAPQNQLEIVSQASVAAPDVQFIIFPSPEFPKAVLDNMRNPNLYFPETADSQLCRVFAATEDPYLYYVNQYGRISFAGPSITLMNAQEIIKGKEYKTVPPLSSAEIIKLIEKEITGLGEQIVSTEQVTLENGVDLYVTMLAPRTRGAYLFSRVESRLSVCDVCHDTHFIYTFDQEGIIRDFMSIGITKYGNVPWTAEDVKKMKSGLVGKSIFSPFTFNPKVDAVTTATMSSSLIFEAIGQAQASFADFKNYQFRKEHWEAVCFRNMCVIQDAMEQMKKAGMNPLRNGTEIDFEQMKNYLPGGAIPACPLGEKYLPMGDTILCSGHGINLKGCGK